MLSKADWEGKDFGETTLEPPLGSGPYVIEEGSIDPGRSIVYRRNPDYWARDLAVNVGRYNFDRIRYDYYRDATVAVEALKAGEYDFRRETSSKRWATGYDGPALEAGMLRQELLVHRLPAGMQSFVFNTRRPIFADARVREALAFAFDFEWTNRQLFHGQYERSPSFFSNSELASSGLPSPDELAILEPWRAGSRIGSSPPRTSRPAPTGRGGSGRTSARRAPCFATRAGRCATGGSSRRRRGPRWSSRCCSSTRTSNGWCSPSARTSNGSGCGWRCAPWTPRSTRGGSRTSTSTWWWARSASPSPPGNEQRDFWGSAAADLPGSRNLAGARDPVVDELVELVISAPDRKALIDRSRALDRVLLWSHYVIPNWHLNAFRIASWDLFGRPETRPAYGLGFDIPGGSTKRRRNGCGRGARSVRRANERASLTAGRDD